MDEDDEEVELLHTFRGHNWFPETDLWWIIVVASVSFTLLGLFLYRKLSLKLSLDIMEHCHVDTLKVSLKSIWMNVAVTAALVLSIICAMVQVDQDTAYYASDESTREAQILLRQGYVAVLTIASLFETMALFFSVIHLIYVEPLNNVDVAKFMVANPSSLGDVTVSLIIGFVFLGMSFMMWVLSTYGVPNFLVSLLCSSVMLVMGGSQLWDKATFDPREKTEKAEAWRFIILDPASWPKKAFGYDAKAVAVLKRFGALIEESIEAKRSQSLEV